jgi:hypothetical protein
MTKFKIGQRVKCVDDDRCGVKLSRLTQGLEYTVVKLDDYIYVSGHDADPKGGWDCDRFIPVEEKQWKPIGGQIVWHIHDYSVITSDYYTGEPATDCFRTRSMARKALKEIKKVLMEAKHG